MPIDPAQTYLNFYVGMTEVYDEYLFLDLKIPTREINLWVSQGSIDSCSGEDLLSYLERGLNEASLYTKNLGIRLRIDMETIAGLFEDFSDRDKRNIHELIKETRNVKKVS